MEEPLSCTCSIRTERSMGRIVAAPTAGSCGIVPAAVLTMQEQYQLTEEECVMSLFTASAVGMVIANNASLAGAQGGCQAECGSASAMAAAAIVELAGGTPDMIQSAVATALKNILGLVCDPVAGLVEIPCIKRNASGVAGAFVAAELALAGIRSAIPADEVIWTMKKVGDVMPTALKETAEGGLAATPTGRKLHQQVFGEMK
ncbi:L-serine ammonia-lyase, iron-sulfur-dependent, subunit alpha [Ruminococcus sp. AM42-11]|uniref:L-serine ammonia-lyase, iron-sulfur-dependent, subunit alpha n=1 Tax=Ruminococcus sp. AM42-11 TaxID=2292372 RepID=UPI001FAB0463|nr:L-serine ammonia-lyase, iron-sulfur-dependent, subunit alpha [Ruminococcus sp. AM42-11]